MRKTTTTFGLDSELFEQLKAIAKERDISMSKMLEKILANWVATEVTKGE